MDVSTQRRDGAIVLVVTGDIDLGSRGALETRIADAVREPVRAVEVDLSGVDFLDSSGIASLVAGWRMSDAAGRSYRVIAAAPLVQEIMSLAGVWDLLSGGT